jgi:hypothetical protein
MLIKAILTCLLPASALAAPGLFHEEAHHTHEVLDNIHNTPHCAYTCIFHEEYPGKYAPECLNKAGKEYGACLCRSDAFQYILDQCVALRCDGKARKTVTSPSHDNAEVLILGKGNELQEL